MITIDIQGNRLSQVLTLVVMTCFPLSCTVSQVVPSSKISDSPTTIIGFNHIGLSVQDLEEVLSFYLKATDFELVKRESVSQSKNVTVLFGLQDLSYETATLMGPNMLLELTQYSNQQNAIIKKMSPQGPGMTHTCYQSPDWDSGYEKFKAVGADVLSRGDQPIDLGGYGVTYAYAYDPEGNMFELEQVAQHRIPIDSLWVAENPMWMTQVALISPDLDKLDDYYEMVLAIPPAREGKYENHPKLNDVIDVDSSIIHATWFSMDGLGKMLELMQYDNPVALKPPKQKHPTDLGYSFSIEVGDIKLEYERLKKLGVQFLSEPQILGEFWMVFANDIDGNVFSLRQATSPHSIYATKNLLKLGDG